MTARTARTVLLAALAVAQLPAAPRAQSAKPATVEARLPADAAAYVDRRMGCNHWMGEDAYDADRGREIAAAVKALRCDVIEADERRLRRRHGRDPAVLKALDRVRDVDG